VVRLPWVERPALGEPDAEVIVIEYTDYACPYCQRFHQTTWPVLKRDFVDTGQIRWAVRDLPLPIHPDARGAAQAAHCAGEQGRFWEMRSVLFANQGALGREALEKYAVSEGLRPAAFRSCLDSDKHLAAIEADVSDAAQARITGTPTFLVGRRKGDYVEGRLIVGAQGSAVFDSAIRLELAAAADRAAQ
jgi:protein-disulfide isomerase